MGSATVIISKVDRLLSKLNATERPVYKRVITRTGGDDLIGRGSTATHEDTLLSPQPVMTKISETSQILASGSSNLQIGDWVMTASPTALTQTDLLSKDLLIVFKEGTNEESLRVLSFDAPALYGQALAYNVFLRSIER